MVYRMVVRLGRMVYRMVCEVGQDGLLDGGEVGQDGLLDGGEVSYQLGWSTGWSVRLVRMVHWMVERLVRMVYRLVLPLVNYWKEILQYILQLKLLSTGQDSSRQRCRTPFFSNMLKLFSQLLKLPYYELRSSTNLSSP